MIRTALILLMLTGCTSREVNPPTSDGVAVGNPGSGKLTIGGSEGLAMTSAEVLGGSLRLEHCDGAVELLALADPLDLLGDDETELPTGEYCELELSVTRVEVAGDGFAMSLDVPTVAFAADGLVVDRADITVQLGQDGWLTAGLLELADDPEDIQPGSDLHDLLVARLLHGTGVDSSNDQPPLVPRTDGGGTVVAVGIDGKIVRSVPAGGWTSQQVGLGPLNDVAFGEGMFVAVGGDNLPEIYVSADGETWTPVYPPGTEYLLAVTWGDGRFVATGIHDARFVSPDGISWEAATADWSTYTRGVAWGNGTYVAVGEDGYDGNWSRSNTGEVWNPLTVGGSLFYDVAFGNGEFIAVGADGRIGRSDDGSSFIDRYGGNKLRGVTWGEDRWVAVGLNRISTSLDGGEWTDVAEPGEFWEVTWAGDRFVAVANFGQILESEDGEDWTEVRSGDGYPLYGVTFKP